MAKTIEAYAREVAASYGFNEERTATFTAYAKRVAEMDALQVREAMFSKDLPDSFARLLVTARQMEISGEPLSDDDEAAPDYSANRAAADELEKAGKKELAAIHRAAIAAAEASDKAGSDE
jgi:hypothetical protein